MTKEYGEDFARVSTSISSEGIAAVGSGGFVDMLEVIGSAYFEDGSAPATVDVFQVINQAFQTDIELYIEILSESSDAFLSSLNIVDVKVQTPSSYKDESSGLGTWVVVGIAGASSVFSAALLCILCMLCLGEPDEDDEATSGTKKKSDDSQGLPDTQKTSTKSSEEESPVDIDVESGSGIGLHFQEHLEALSITSQDSSKFTYNPRSDMTDAGFTFQSGISREGNSSIVDTDLWKYGSVIPESTTNGVELPFEQDLSAIVIGKDGNPDIIEGGIRSIETDPCLLLTSTDLLSPTLSQATGGTPGGSMAGMSEVGIGIIEDDIEPSRKMSKPRSRSFAQVQKNGAAQGIHDDLNDLSQMVAAHRNAPE